MTFAPIHFQESVHRDAARDWIRHTGKSRVGAENFEVVTPACHSFHDIHTEEFIAPKVMRRVPIGEGQDPGHNKRAPATEASGPPLRYRNRPARANLRRR